MKSTCVDVCRFDGRTGWFVACGRTLTEARGWRKKSRPKLLAIMAELPRRLAKLSSRDKRSAIYNNDRFEPPDCGDLHGET
ncbi:DUF1289 domain-containing protein [Sphingomonas sp. GB1N7]|uniref:DUF1289 domain-containing protein n=1 Tax=Parasphingomonas caseinilytica TaxID=3096158 RepID=UPI002FCB7C63